MERQVLGASRLASTAPSLPIHLLSSCETGQQLWRRFGRRAKLVWAKRFSAQEEEDEGMDFMLP